jgi:hypothetical protein
MEQEALDDVLIDRAAWTHARLTAGRQHVVELHEETITQDLLLDISTDFPAITVTTFTKQREGRNGADWQWEWWFEGRQWSGLWVQAKRLKRLASDQLGYDLNYKRGNKRQIDLLIEDASRAGMQAAYVLYNGPDLNIDTFKWGCRRLPARAAFFGVSFVLATVARDLADAGTVDLGTVGGHSRPWSCLASCDPSACPQLPGSEILQMKYPSVDSADLPWWIAQRFLRIESQTRRTFDPDARRDPATVPRVPPGLLEGLPRYVARLLSRGLSADTGFPRRVGALTIFRQPS